MLVLTRKAGEQIVVNDAIRVTVVAIQGDRVRLGITAPRETLVDRQEIHERRIARLKAPPQGKLSAAEPGNG
jgi:carbon storage regulator